MLQDVSIILSLKWQLPKIAHSEGFNDSYGNIWWQWPWSFKEIFDYTHTYIFTRHLFLEKTVQKGNITQCCSATILEWDVFRSFTTIGGGTIQVYSIMRSERLENKRNFIIHIRIWQTTRANRSLFFVFFNKIAWKIWDGSK